MEVASDTTRVAGRIVIKTLSGNDVCQFDFIPTTVRDLKIAIANLGHMPVALQKLLHEDGFAVCEDVEVLPLVDQAMILITDETPLWYWDSANNEEVSIEDNVLKCPSLRTDYTNVITREPVSIGLHYFEFHMHYYGDEQWCGLTPDKCLVGSAYEVAVPSKIGYMYYTGRNKGALEARGHHLKEFQYVTRSGSVIGMLVDCDMGAVAFDLNGTIQGACEIPKNTPLWVLTHLDTPRDHVELQKPCLQDAPPTNFEALKGALLDISQGTLITRNY